MKKTLIILIAVILMATAAVGCAQSGAVDTKPAQTPTPTATPSAEPTHTPTPTATPTQTPQPVSVILQEVTDNTDFEIPDAYGIVTFDDDVVVGADIILYTLYGFEDKEGKKYFRAYGYRTDPTTNAKYDEGIYAIDVTETEKDGVKSVIVTFDALNAMPVDLSQEKSLYLEKKETQKKTDAKGTAKPKAEKTDSKTASDKNTSKSNDAEINKATEPAPKAEQPVATPAPTAPPKQAEPPATPAPVATPEPPKATPAPPPSATPEPEVDDRPRNENGFVIHDDPNFQPPPLDQWGNPIMP